MEEIRDCYEANLQSIDLYIWKNGILSIMDCWIKFEDILLRYVELFVVVFCLHPFEMQTFTFKN